MHAGRATLARARLTVPRSGVHRRMVVRIVQLSDRAKKDLRKTPQHVAGKLALWVAAVERQGLAEVRKVPGYHDEPLRGDRAGQRSIRLSLQWRAIYVEVGGETRIARVEEVTPHEY